MGRTFLSTLIVTSLFAGDLLAETSPGFRFVSEYRDPCDQAHGKTCDDLELLQLAVDEAASDGALLYVDGLFEIHDTLVLPKTSTLRGDGPNGGPIGTILFKPTVGFRPMLAIEGEGKSDVVISDLFLEDSGDQSPTVAIDLSSHSQVYLHRLQIALFDVGVFGFESLSIWITDCVVRNSDFAAYFLAQRSNSWRIRGGIASQSAYGALVLDSRDALIQGVRMESNRIAAVWTNSQDTHLGSNYFEGNGSADRTAVIIHQKASDAMLVGNYFALNGTPSQADDQIIRNDGSRTIRLDSRRDMLWPEDVNIEGHVHLQRRAGVGSTGISFQSEMGTQWTLRHLSKGDLVLSRFNSQGQFLDFPLRIDEANASVEIGAGLQVGSSGPKICGGEGPPPTDASEICDPVNGSMYLDSLNQGRAYLRVSGRWVELATR